MATPKGKSIFPLGGDFPCSFPVGLGDGKLNTPIKRAAVGERRAYKSYVRANRGKERLPATLKAKNQYETHKKGAPKVP